MTLYHVYSAEDDSVSKMFLSMEAVRAFLESQDIVANNLIAVDTISILEDGDYNRTGHKDGEEWLKLNPKA